MVTRCTSSGPIFLEYPGHMVAVLRQWRGGLRAVQATA